MMPVETFFGFGGALLFLMMILYVRKALKHFKSHRDVSMVKFLIDERGENAFVFLAVTAFFYSIAMVVTGLEFLLGSYPLLVGSRALILGVAVMLAYFLRQVYILTKKNPDED